MATGKMHTKFGSVFELCKRTDRQADRHTHYNTSYPSWHKVTRHSQIEDFASVCNPK